MALETTGVMPMAPAVGSTGLGGIGGVGLVGLIGINSLLGNNLGYPNNTAIAPTNQIIEQTLGQLRKDIADAALEASKVESRIQAAIQVQDTNSNVNFRALDNKICETEKSAIITGKDAQIEALKTEARLSERMTAFERNVDGRFCDNAKDIMGVNFNLEKVNTHLTHLIDKSICSLSNEALKNKADLSLQIERGFCHLREEELEDKLAECQRNQALMNQNLLFSNQFTTLTNAVNSILTHQQLTNKVVQFGAGNTAIPVATNQSA